MAFKRSLVLSLLLGLAGGVGAYILAWGFFSTHSELGVESATVRSIALWAAPVVFFGSLIYFATRSRER